MDEALLRRALMNTPVRQIRTFDSIGSTNDEALSWVDEGAPDYALVIADKQTKGRGRFARKWITQPGTSLAFSLILALDEKEKASPSPLYAPLCGLAVWQALHGSLGLEPLIKWPNDILLDRKKCCGILVEAAWSGTQCKGVVLGIGINISEGSIPPVESPLFPATWLEAHTLNPVDRFDLLAEVINNIQYWRERLGTPEFFQTWRHNLAFRNEPVRIVENENSSIIGIEEGIDANGNLLLRGDDGEQRVIEVGDVHLRPESTTTN